METVKTDNELIAEFMGGVHEKCDIMTVGGKRTGKWTFPNGKWCFDDQLDYDVQWNRLMPVVEKIESLLYDGGHNYQVTIDNVSCTIEYQYHMRIHRTWEKEGDKKITFTYKAVVEFIKWHQKS